MKSLAESMTILANQLDRIKKAPNSELHYTINDFLGIIKEVMDFIQE